MDIHFGIGETGLDILPYIKSTSQMTQVILLTAMERAYGQSVTENAGDLIFDFMSKPVTETELVIKIKKAMASNNAIADKVKDLQSKNTVLTSILDNANLQNAAGRAFEKEVGEKIKSMSKVFMQGEFAPKNNVIINGQEIDTIAFTTVPLPFSVLLFEAKYFPNAKLIGGVNEPTKVISNGTEITSEKRRNLFEQSDNQFKQVSKRIEKILKDNNFNNRDEKLRPFIQTFVIFTDSSDISQLDTSNANKYVKLLKLQNLTPDIIIKTVFSLPKRTVPEQVKKLILENLTK